MAALTKDNPDIVSHVECIRIHTMIDKRLEGIESQQTKSNDKINEMHATLTNGLVKQVQDIVDRNKWFFRLLVSMLFGFIVNIIIMVLKK